MKTNKHMFSTALPVTDTRNLHWFDFKRERWQFKVMLVQSDIGEQASALLFDH